MRARSTTVLSWSHPHLKAARFALASGTLAGLAVLGACADGSVASKIAAPRDLAPRFGVIPAGDLNHTILVCLDPSSSPGTYHFVISQDLNPTPEATDVVTTPLDLVPGFAGGPCVTVLLRSSTIGANTVIDLNTGLPILNFDTNNPPVGSSPFNPSAVVHITGTGPAGYTFNISCAVPVGTTIDPTLIVACGPNNPVILGSNIFHGSVVTYKFTAPSTGPCVLPNAIFGLGPAGAFTGLGVSGAQIDFGHGTYMFGDLGLGPLNTGKVGKTRLEGNIVRDPSATVVIGSDVVIVPPGTTTTASLAAASAAAFAASANLANPILFPVTHGPAVSVIGNSVSNIFTFTDAPGPGPNVISLNTVSLNKGSIRIVGTSTDVFIFNVTGPFSLYGNLQLVGVKPSNVIFNFPTTGGEIVINGNSIAANGIFLAPRRILKLDNAFLTGALIGGGLQVHSGATLVCEKA